MKKYFIIGLISIIILALGIVAYGAYLNYKGENIIVERLENRTIPLKGEKIKFYELKPGITINAATLYSDHMTDAVARVEGMIAESYVHRNSHVAKDAALCRIINEEIPLKIMQIESNLLKADAEKRRYANMYSRYQELMRYNATSKEKLEEIETAFLASGASVDELAAQKEQLLVMQSRQTVVSPIEGEVLIVYRQPGTYVQVGTAVALVGNFKKLLFELSMDDRVISQIAAQGNLQATFSRGDFDKIYNTEYESGNKGENQIFAVKVAEIYPPMSEPAKLRKVIWEVDNSTGLLEPQNYGSISIKTEQTKNVLAVPLTAMTDENNTMVFIVNEDNVLESRKVNIGSNDGVYAEVINGLQAGDTVITSGTTGLEEGMKVTVELEGNES